MIIPTTAKEFATEFYDQEVELLNYRSEKPITGVIAGYATNANLVFVKSKLGITLEE